MLTESWKNSVALDSTLLSSGSHGALLQDCVSKNVLVPLYTSIIVLTLFWPELAITNQRQVGKLHFVSQ